MEIDKKLSLLLNYLKELESALIAFSGGVDSTLLLYLANKALGDKAVAITAVSETFPDEELELAKKFTLKYSIPHIEIRTNELQDKNFIKNSPLRCYYCKKNLFSTIINKSNELKIKHVLEASNKDDTLDYRPGLKALQELGIISPFIKYDFTKKEIRELSKKFNLPTASKPSSACLASRIPYGEEITAKKLEMIEKAEKFLHEYNFKQVRVRYHGNIARIEVLPEDLERILNIKSILIENFKKLGFIYITIDLEGYRSGSMNEILKK